MSHEDDRLFDWFIRDSHARHVFGIEVFLMHARLAYPSRRRTTVKQYLENRDVRTNSRRVKSSTPTVTHHETGTVPQLDFSQLDISEVPSRSLSICGPVMLRVHATVRNVSGNSISVTDLPILYCAETDELVVCEAEADVIAHGESAEVWYEIFARDAFDGWLVFQMADGAREDRLVFSGMETLSELITDGILRCFDMMRPRLDDYANAIADRAGGAWWNDEVLDRVLAIMPSGKYFHTDPKCSGTRSNASIRVRDAYKAGLRPCQKCVGEDWWYDKYYSSPEGNRFWLVTPGGAVVTSWEGSSYSAWDYG